MEWYQVLMIIVSIAGVFFWTNSRIDKLNEKITNDTRDIIKEIRDSNLDFHGRLCSIEERKK